MFITLFTVIGVVNIIAQNYNYNINITRNPDFDIRVRRSLEEHDKYIIQPHETDNQQRKTSRDDSDEVPLLLEILKGRKGAETDDKSIKVKRDTYSQYTQTNGNNNNGNSSNGNNNGNSNMGHFKANPDFITRTYNKVVQVFGLAQTTPKHKSAYTSVNNGYVNQNNGVNYTYGNQMTNNDRFYNPYNTSNYNYPIPYSNYQNTYNTSTFNTNTNYYNGYNGFNPTLNNSFPYAPYNNQFNSYNASTYTYYNNNFNTAMNTTYNRHNGTSFVPYNTNNDRRNINNGTVLTTTTEKIATGCILCNTFSCAVNQKRVGFRCVDLDYDYYQ